MRIAFQSDNLNMMDYAETSNRLDVNSKWNFDE
jgi:hypothetical protein